MHMLNCSFSLPEDLLNHDLEEILTKLQWADKKV